MELTLEDEKTPQFYSVVQTEFANMRFGAVADIYELYIYNSTTHYLHKKHINISFD